MKWIFLFIVPLITLSCNSGQSISEDYFFARGSSDTLLVFPTNELVLLRNGESYYFSARIPEIKKPYRQYHDKDDMFVVLSEHGSPYRLFDGYISLLKDSGEQKIDFLELTIFYPGFLIDEELDIYQSSFVEIKNSNEYKEKAIDILLKERDFSNIMLRIDGVQ
jgi:hypothetical protein